eukprot:g4392.t1
MYQQHQQQPQDPSVAGLAQLLALAQQGSAAPPQQQLQQQHPAGGGGAPPAASNPNFSGPSPTRLFVSGPGFYDKHDISALFQPYGRLKEVRYEPSSSRAAHGTVDFVNPEDADAALREMHGTKIDGFSMQRPPMTGGGRGGGMPPGGFVSPPDRLPNAPGPTKVFCLLPGRLPLPEPDHDLFLEQLFGRFGKLRYTQLVPRKRSFYGFVGYERPSDADRARGEMHGTVVSGFELAVRIAGKQDPGDVRCDDVRLNPPAEPLMPHMRAGPDGMRGGRGVIPPNDLATAALAKKGGGGGGGGGGKGGGGGGGGNSGPGGGGGGGGGGGPMMAAAINPRDTPGGGIKIFVGGLSQSVNDASLREFFSRYARVVSAEVLYDRNTKRSRGFGYVIFDQPVAA